jgi:hypothetical protein
LSFPNIQFHPAGGGELSTKDDMFMLPHFYVASDFGMPEWRFGLGFNVPFGNSITWGSGNQISALVDKSTMAIYSITPSVAYEINEQLSVGVGLNILYGDLLSRFKYAPRCSIPISSCAATAWLWELPLACFGNRIGATLLGLSIAARFLSTLTETPLSTIHHHRTSCLIRGHLRRT